MDIKERFEYQELASGDVRIIDKEFDKFDERHIVIDRDSLDTVGVSQVRIIAGTLGIYPNEP